MWVTNGEVHKALFNYDDAKREVEMLRLAAKHARDNVIELLDCYTPSNGSCAVVLVMAHGESFDYKSATREQLVDMFEQLLRTLVLLHPYMVHGDLKVMHCIDI